MSKIIANRIFWYNLLAVPVLLGAMNKLVGLWDTVFGFDVTKILIVVGLGGECVVFLMAAIFDSQNSADFNSSKNGTADTRALPFGPTKPTQSEIPQFKQVDEKLTELSQLLQSINVSTMRIADSFSGFSGELQNLQRNFARVNALFATKDYEPSTDFELYPQDKLSSENNRRS
jgi:hypothetical protein